MKKAIIVSLAVVGGLTLAATALVGTVAAVETAKAKKRYAKMTPEEREMENIRRAALLSALLAVYGKKCEETAAEEEAADVDMPDEETVTA